MAQESDYNKLLESLSHKADGKIHPQWLQWQKINGLTTTQRPNLEEVERRQVNQVIDLYYQVRIPKGQQRVKKLSLKLGHNFSIGQLPKEFYDLDLIKEASREHRQAHNIVSDHKRKSNDKLPAFHEFMNALLSSPRSVCKSINELKSDSGNGLRFKVARSIAGLSQEFIRKKLKVIRSQVVRHESNEEPLSIDQIEACADLLHCNTLADGTALPGRWLLAGSHVRWWDVAFPIPETLDEIMATYHPTWARRWIRPFASFMAQRRELILNKAKGLDCLPSVSKTGQVIMQTFTISRDEADKPVKDKSILKIKKRKPLN